eukprot:700078-Rhodomonas_salina.2
MALSSIVARIQVAPNLNSALKPPERSTNLAGFSPTFENGPKGDSISLAPYQICGTEFWVVAVAR